MSDSRNSQNSDETRIAGEIDHLSGTGMAETRVAADRDPPATPTSGSSNCDPSATRIASGDLLRERGAEATANPIERWKVGDRINEDYEVREIHRGGMGVVYGTFHHPSGTLRALKTLQDRFASIPRLRKAFEAEAAIWLRLEKHPFIAQALGIEMVDDLPYVVTEFIPAREGRGADLRSWIGDPTVGLPSALEFAIQIAQGMQHAVSIVSGLVHRDLKPANILVNDRFQAMVTDFGLAASAGLEGGTPAYMAPEQWRNEALDSRTDIYAFGCILYELLTRHRVFAAITEGQWKAAHAESQPYPPRGHVPDLPAELEAFVLACLQKNRDLRPPSWDQVVGFLALQFHRITGQPVIADFSNYRPTAEDVVRAGFDFTVLGEQGEEALKLFDRALAAGTLSLGGYAASVFCCASGLESGHEEAALRVWNKLIVHAMNPAFPNSALFYLSRALFHRLRLLLQMGRSEEALRCQVEYQQVVECVSSRNGDNGEDVRVFRAKVEVDTIELLSSLLGPEKVIVACEANIARFGNDTHPEVHFSVCTAIGAKGKALRKAKRSEEFESFSKEVLARFPDDQGVKEAVDNARNSFVGIAANLPGRPTFDLHLKAKEPVALNFKLPLADPSKAHQGSANEARNPLFPNHGAFDFNFSLPAEPRSVASPEAPRMGRTEGPGWGASAAPFERKPPRRWPILLAIGVVAVLIGLCLFGLPVP